MKKLFAAAIGLAALLYGYGYVEHRFTRAPIDIPIVRELTPAETARKESLEAYRHEIEEAREARAARRRAAAFETQQRDNRELEQKLLELRLSR